MEKIKIVTQNRVEKINNSFGEICQDYIREKEFIFEKGKIYGIVGEYGEGGELISAIMSGQVSIKNEIIYVDGEKLQDFKLKNISWYVGKKEYANFEISDVVRAFRIYTLVNNKVFTVFYLNQCMSAVRTAQFQF